MSNCYRCCLKNQTNFQYLFIFLILIKSVTEEDTWWEWKKSPCINQKQWYEIKPIRIKVCFVYKPLRSFSFFLPNPPQPPFFVSHIQKTESPFSSWGKQRAGFCRWYRGLLCSERCPASGLWEKHCAPTKLSVVFLSVHPSYSPASLSTARYNELLFMRRLFLALISYLEPTHNLWSDC